MPFGREIWLLHVKCLRTWVDLFHFTCAAKFHGVVISHPEDISLLVEKAV